MSSQDQFSRVDQAVSPTATGRQLSKISGTPSVAFGAQAPATVTLAENLFRAPERWGWEFVEPRPASTYPHVGQYPQWKEPPQPDLSDPQRRHAIAKAKLAKQLAWAGGLVLVGLITLGASVGFGLFLILIGGVIGGRALYMVNAPLSAIRNLEQQSSDRKHTLRQEFNKVKASWDAKIAQHDQSERQRLANTPLLYPLALTSVPSRVDVFGGTPAGWAALLATLSGSALTGGSSILVLDLSGQEVSGALQSLSQARGVPLTTVAVPNDLSRGGLLGDLDGRELADVLSEAMGSMRPKTDQVDLQSMDAELIHTVARRLERPLTFARLAAGVEVLRSIYDPDTEGPLSADEVRKLTNQVDLIDKSERVRDELRFIGNQLELLVEGRGQSGRRDGTGTEAVDLWSDHGLTVVQTDSRNRRQKDFADRVLFQAVVHSLADKQVPVGDPMLIVVGADELGRSSLEAMVRNAWGARVRLVYLFEHLREDTADMLGGMDSVALLMRLGNGREAATAAEYIGRGHTFKLSQLTRQMGRTATDGGSSSTTDTEGGSESVTRGRSDTSTSGGSFSGGSHSSRSFGTSWSHSLTDTWSTSWQKAKNWSESTSTTDGQTLQRSYDFSVEPTEIQNLEPTQFILVDSAPQGRRITMGDCFPGIAMVDRVSLTPRPS
ncbi:MAG: hypothetical protein ACJ72N_02330 [Labedaea sp.]